MFYRHSYNSTGPLTYIGSLPVYATTVIVAVYVSGAILWLLGVPSAAFILSQLGVQSPVLLWPLVIDGTLPGFFFNGTLSSILSVWPEALADGSVTSIFVRTLVGLFGYVLSTLAGPITFWWVVDLVFLYIFGREMEQHLGRLRFSLFYLLWYLIPPSVGYLVFGFDSWCFLWGAVVAANNPANLAVFIAFASVYPSAQMLGGIKAKYWAWGILAFEILHTGRGGGLSPISALFLFFVFLPSFSSYFAAWFMVRGRYQLNTDRLTRAWSKTLRMASRPKAKTPPKKRTTSFHDPTNVVDELLDKISRDGLSSLTVIEQEQLERARKELIRRGNT